MAERPRTPSPNKSRNLEKGVFSSLSTLAFFNPQDKKVASAVSSTQFKFTPTKYRSPFRTRHSPSPIHQSIPKTKCDPTNQSPIYLANRKEPTDNRQSDERALKLQDTIKRLSAQLTKEKRNSQQLELSLKEAQGVKNSEMSAIVSNIERAQRTIESLRSAQQSLSSEKEKFVSEASVFTEKLAKSNSHIESMAYLLVTVVETVFNLFSETSTEQQILINNVHSAVIEEFYRIRKDLNVNLKEHIEKANSWVESSDMPEDNTYVSQAGAFDYVQNEDIPISYTVEYFDEPYTVKEDPGINRNEMSFTNDFAVALYDFDGERDGDLTLSAGDTIEIMEKNESGWWTGRLGTDIGVFPHNFVQLM